MSYRAFKRLMGESSLERKSRFLLGALTLLLISGSFYLYARLTADLAYDATTTSGRLLASQVLYNYHVKNEEAKAALQLFQERSEKLWPEALSGYKYKLYKPHSREPAYKPDGDEREIVERFISDPESNEATRLQPKIGKFFYYGAIRPVNRCMSAACHPLAAERADLPSLREGQLYGVVRIQLDSHVIEEGAHLNRAILISSALITSLLIMTGSYMIVRYVIVKPVRHLKEVSDAVSAGYLNVRSEIQTGDEFEDLSFAFNRMLRNLVSVQDELRQTNTALDHKVDELARANLALFQSNKLKGDFLATVSHELRTPLHSILGFSDLMHQSENFTDKQLRWAKNIRTSGAHLLDLINDILDLAKIEAGKLDVKPEPLDMAQLIDRIAGDLRPLAEKKGLDFQTTVAEEFPPVVQDRGKLHQILSNLISNAIKFTPDGGRVDVRAAVENDELVLTVSDTGVGIAPADQEVVFEKFRQGGSNPMTREHEGTGLGLSIVRELTQLLSGEVSLQSELGRGSTFTVRLPVKLPAANGSAPSADPAVGN